MAKKSIKVSVTEFKEICRAFLTQKTSFAVRVDGYPGVGKSEIVSQIAEEANYHFIDTRLAFKDNVDLAGHLFPNRETKIAEFLKPEDLPSEEMLEGKKGIVWFFDEVNRVMHPSILNTLFQIISTNHCATHQLPKNTFIFLAGNLGEEDGTIVTDYEDAAFDGRCAKFYLDPNFNEWIPWAESADVHSSIIHFLKKNTEYFSKLRGRAWFQAYEVLTLFGVSECLVKLKKGESVVTKFFQAVIGSEATKEYAHFLKEFDELDETMILDDFEKHRNQLKDTARERIFTLSNKINEHFKKIDENDKFDTVNQTHLVNAIRYGLFLDKDSGAKFISELFQRYKFLETYATLQEEKKLSFTNEEIQEIKSRYK